MVSDNWRDFAFSPVSNGVDLSIYKSEIDKVSVAICPVQSGRRSGQASNTFKFELLKLCFTLTRIDQGGDERKDSYGISSAASGTVFRLNR